MIAEKELQASLGNLPAAKILVVDDRPENLLTMEAVLAPMGEQVIFANSGFDALRHLLRGEFAVVLMDAQMPELDGFETAELIRGREKTRHLPIIFITAYSGDEHQVFQGYSVGAVDYITKPFDPDILRSKVRVFVELYKRGEDIKRHQEFIRAVERRESERQLLEQQRELEQEHMRQLAIELESRVAERTAQLTAANEELEAFCYSVSHDLRTPLRAIAATSNILMEDAGSTLNQEQRECLQRQAAAATKLGKLIDDLLQLSRLGRRDLDKHDIDLSAIAREVAKEVLGRGWPNAPTIKVASGMHANADPDLTRLLLQNLLDNACKYSPDGGRVDVGFCQKDGTGAFYVKDNGIGFDMQYAHKVFLPFERLVLESEYPGTGIGLASVERIVRRHGGRVWPESEPGQGSTFFFTLGDSRARIERPAVSVI